MNKGKTKEKSNLDLIRILLPYYKKNMAILAADFFCAALTTVCDLTLPILISLVTDTAGSRTEELTMNFVLKISGIYVILRLVEIAARYFMQSTGHIMGARIERDMRAAAYRHFHTLPHSYFATHKTGNIIANLTTDLFDVTEFSHHCPEEYFIGAVKLIASFIILSGVNLTLTLVLFAMIPIYFIVSSNYRKKLRRTQMQQRKQIGAINSSIEDSIQGIYLVKSFGNESIENAKFNKDNSGFLKIKEHFYKALAGFQSVSRIFDALMLTASISLGGIFLLEGYISAGEFVAYILYTQTLLVTLARIIEFTEQFERGMTGLLRFSDVMETKSDIVEKDDAVQLRNVKGDILFENVDFTYPDSDEQVLKNLNLHIETGRTVAIVGPSGGGKTTLSNLIPRFYDVSGGSIKIDGEDVRDVSIESLRNNIGTVQQDVYLFSDTVRANIEYGRPGASYEDIVRAAKLAGAYDFISEMPDGFETYVGEKGVMLSGGQKQRISIARVFLKNPPVLILDEATSALDNESEMKVQKSLKILSEKRTTIIIAHRLSTIRDADEIILLKDGVIRERGCHEELIKLNGLYSKLYKMSIGKTGISDSAWDEASKVN